uniref:Uncharacterized protein n=1 Tax=Meloidogyne javanica TaxID=6303 RepID=A0A915LVB5_MELJA
MNVANSLLVMAFVVVPEWLADSKNDIGRFNRTRHIKAMPTKFAVHADELNTVLDFGKMTSNTRKSKLSSGKQEQYVFTWKAINGWDYNIGEPETAASLAMANAIKLKV